MISDSKFVLIRGTNVKRRLSIAKKYVNNLILTESPETIIFDRGEEWRDYTVIRNNSLSYVFNCDAPNALQNDCKVFQRYTGTLLHFLIVVNNLEPEELKTILDSMVKGVKATVVYITETDRSSVCWSDVMDTDHMQHRGINTAGNTLTVLLSDSYANSPAVFGYRRTYSDFLEDKKEVQKICTAKDIESDVVLLGTPINYRKHLVPVNRELKKNGTIILFISSDIKLRRNFVTVLNECITGKINKINVKNITYDDLKEYVWEDNKVNVYYNLNTSCYAYTELTKYMSLSSLHVFILDDNAEFVEREDIPYDIKITNNAKYGYQVVCDSKGLTFFKLYDMNENRRKMREIY